MRFTTASSEGATRGAARGAEESMGGTGCQGWRCAGGGAARGYCAARLGRCARPVLRGWCAARGLNACAPALGTSPLKIYHFFLSLIRCAPALGTSPSPSFEGGFSDGVGERRVHSKRGGARHPQPPWKGGFLRELRRVRVKRGSHATSGVRKTPPLTRPKQPAGLRSPPLRCAVSYTRTLDHPPPRGLTCKKTPPPAGEAGRG